MVILKLTSPVTQSIINTMKRIFILATSIVVFNTPISTNGIIGSIIAIIGSYLYSMFSIKNK
jgi:drug/metabolite transporter (DMT)-like permease